jgi:homeobox-leucine zipper protein
MEDDVIKIMYKRKDDGTNTAIVCASASFMLPVPMRRAFDVLKNNILHPKVR